MTEDKLPARSDKLISMLLIEIHNLLIDENEELHELKDLSKKLTEVEISNQKILNSILEKDSAILEEQKAEADEGKYRRLSGTVTTSQFTIIDTITDPGHSIKGYKITNDGPNSILFAHNVTISSISPDIVDTISNDSRFELLLLNETSEVSYNRRKIDNVYLLASGGNSDFRAKLVW